MEHKQGQRARWGVGFLAFFALVLLLSVYLEDRNAFLTNMQSQYQGDDMTTTVDKESTVDSTQKLNLNSNSNAKENERKSVGTHVTDFLGKATKVLSNIGSSSSKDKGNENGFSSNIVKSRCQTGPDFDEAFEQKFVDTCGWWIDQVKEWREKVNYNSYFYAHQMRSGTGDRLAGSMTTFNYAMQKGQVLNLSWTKIDSVFTPSCYVTSESEPSLVNLNGERAHKLQSRACLQQSYYKCSLSQHNADKCPTYNRACLSKNSCQSLADRYGRKMNMAHVLGCPMRLSFQPKQDFMEHDIKWFIDGKDINGTLSELVYALKQYETIALHLRLGDTYMRHAPANVNKTNSNENRVLSKSKECMDWVDAYISNQELSKSTGKPIKWIVASDDEKIRNYFRVKHPEKTVILSAHAHHVSSIKRKKNIDQAAKNTRDLFAEWYLLGVADHMISNNAHNFGMSAFSRSAWIYNLKSQYYEIVVAHPGSCRKKEYGYQGAVSHVEKTCKRPFGEVAPLEQPHLPTKKKK